jgi:hypothetical protein
VWYGCKLLFLSTLYNAQLLLFTIFLFCALHILKKTFYIFVLYIIKHIFAMTMVWCFIFTELNNYITLDLSHMHIPIMMKC